MLNQPNNVTAGKYFETLVKSSSGYFACKSSRAAAHLVLFFVGLLSQSVFAQNDSVYKLPVPKVVPGNFTAFTVDNLGNIFGVNALNQVKKLNAKGDSIAVYNDVRRYGNIYSIDATNPLKILVYYKDFSTIIVLDRLLNVRNTIDLRKQQLFKVQAITSSYDGNIWLFDELTSKIKKIDDQGKTLVETVDFRLVFDKVPEPNGIYDRDGQLYLYDAGLGMLVFDYYGAQKNTLAIKGLSDVQVLDKNTITGRRGSEIILYKPLSLELRSFKTSELDNRFKSLQFTGNRLYALTRNGAIEVYQIP